MTDEIPLLDLGPDVQANKEAYLEAFEQVLDSTQFINGPNVEAFEEEVASYLDVEHAVGLNSGTDALVIALEALGVGPGDEVVTTPFTFFATAEAISKVGATPVFADIHPRTFNLDPGQVESRITEQTAALLPVHLFGHAADMESLVAIAEEHGLPVVEDAAQAFGGEHAGRKLGSIGEIGAFSFFPSKNLGGFGDGGLLTTDDEEIAKRARSLRHHGAGPGGKYENVRIGHNSRLDEVQAALLRLKLERVDDANQRRRDVAARYDDLLEMIEEVTMPIEAESAYHVYHQYTVRLPASQRDKTRGELSKAGISSAVYYDKTLHQLPVYTNLSVETPNAERACKEVLSLPMWPEFAENPQKTVVARIREGL